MQAHTHTERQSKLLCKDQFSHCGSLELSDIIETSLRISFRSVNTFAGVTVASAWISTLSRDPLREKGRNKKKRRIITIIEFVTTG